MLFDLGEMNLLVVFTIGLLWKSVNGFDISWHKHEINGVREETQEILLIINFFSAYSLSISSPLLFFSSRELGTGCYWIQKSKLLMVLIVSSSYTVFKNSLYRWQLYCPVAKTVLYKCCFSLKVSKWLRTLAVNHYWSYPVFQNDLRWICTNSLVHDCSWFEERFDCFQFTLEDKMHWFFWMRGNALKKI